MAAASPQEYSGKQASPSTAQALPTVSLTVPGHTACAAGVTAVELVLPPHAGSKASSRIA
jgi:hypothetical protein